MGFTVLEKNLIFFKKVFCRKNPPGFVFQGSRDQGVQPLGT